MSFSQGFKMKESLSEYIESKLKPTPVAMVAPEVKQNSDADTEITKTCAVLGCEDSKNLETDSFFRFPEDANLKQIWTDLTGRNNWTPTDFSYICIQHFSVDCFTCDASDTMVLVDNAVPSLKLPKHVLEVEYIDEETLDNDEDYEMETDEEQDQKPVINGDVFETVNKQKESPPQPVSVELLELFTEVQKMQRQAVGLKDKLKCNMKMHNRQSRQLERLKDIIETKRKILEQKKKKKSRILLSLQDKIKADTNGLVLAMPSRHTDDLKNFALSIYKYSPQAYIYVRNSLRTMLPSTDVLDTWLSSGFQPKNVLVNSSLIKVVSELSDTELTCKVTLG